MLLPPPSHERQTLGAEKQTTFGWGTPGGAADVTAVNLTSADFDILVPRLEAVVMGERLSSEINPFDMSSQLATVTTGTLSGTRTSKSVTLTTGVQ